MKKIFQERIYTLSLTIIVVCFIFALIYPSLFFTFDNLRQVLLNLSIDTIVAVGMMLLMVSGSFDLSVGSVVAFAGGITANLMIYSDVNVAAAVSAGLLCSLVIGMVNGFLVAYAGINPMIQTLAMMGIVRGLALMVSGSGIQNLPYWFNAIGQSKLLGLQMPVWYMLITVGVFAFLFSRTVFFRRYYYIGGNEKAALLSGIDAKRMKFYGFVIVSLLAGFAGILLSSRLGAALSSSGRGMELRVITAVILGGASLSGGEGKIAGALLGTVFMGVIGNVMVIARVSGYWQEIILGLILIAAVGIDQLFRSERKLGYLPAKKSILQDV
ncbi:MAG TPA: ABC transporter permease [Chitinophagaceae bacterium]|jgi:ribose transport system permease protein|nr:ABC transporter permease [Chitinophagaceae bacterium]